MLGGKPLITWSIDVVRGLAEICDVLVSTDDAEVAAIGHAAGASVPWLRPAELASDTASSVDVALHALDWYEREKRAVDGLLLLQPTSPFRRRDTIKRGIDLFLQNDYRPVIGVSSAESHPMWCFRVQGTAMKPLVEGGGLHLRSQDLPPAYVVNGAFYLITPADLRRYQSFYNNNMVPLVIEYPEENIDIDTKWDWEVAEILANKKYNAYKE